MAGSEGVDLRVDAAGILTGLVVEEGDRPVEGYHLQAQPMGSDEKRRWESEHSKTVGTPGRPVPPRGRGGGQLRCARDRARPGPGHRLRGEGRRRPDHRPGDDPGAARGGRARSRRGRGGRTGDGRPHHREHRRDGHPTWRGLLSDHSDATGAFEVRGVPAGSAWVKAAHPSYAPGRVAVEVDPAKGPAEARLLLRQGGRIEGTARRRDGQPLVGQTIMMGFSDAGAHGHALPHRPVPTGRSWSNTCPRGTSPSPSWPWGPGGS